MQHVDEIVLVCTALCNIKNGLIQTKKIKQSISDIFDDIFDGIFIEATKRQKIAQNFGKFLKSTCERIHFSNVVSV